jgi:hypothetical protein
MKVLLFISSLSISLCALSQGKKIPDVFEEAYIVSLKGDTIRGQIRTSKFKKTEFYQKINFKDKTNKLRLYTPDKIAGYGYKNHYYISAFHDNKPCYFKVLCKGKASLLQISFESIEEGVPQEMQDLCVLPEGQDAELKPLEPKGLKKQLKEIFKSNKTLVQKISDQKEIPYTIEVLEGYFNEFNH